MRWGRAVLLAGLGAAALAAWRTQVYRIDLAPGAQRQAAAASDDPIWREAPGSMERSTDWTILKQRDWFGWGAPRTTVGAHYRFTSPPEPALGAWERAGRSAGWTLVGRLCDPAVGIKASLTFAKPVAEWPGVLTAEYNELSDVITVTLSMDASVGQPDSRGNATASGSLDTAIAACFR